MRLSNGFLADSGWFTSDFLITTNPNPYPCHVVVWLSLASSCELFHQLMVGGKYVNCVSESHFGRSTICRHFWWVVASSLFWSSRPLFWPIGGNDGCGFEANLRVALSSRFRIGSDKFIVCLQPTKRHFLN